MYVYLIQHNNIPEYTKIGYTSNIDQRLQQLNTSSPTGVKVIYSIYSNYAYQLEQALHRKYSSYQSNLEWFKLSHEQLIDIMFWLEETVAKEKMRDQK